MIAAKIQELEQVPDYSWVPWFRELALKINENDQQYLVDHIKAVDWSEAEDTGHMHAYGDRYIDPLADLMIYLVNDPFSFFYFLASRTNWDSMHDIFRSVHVTFDLASDRPRTGQYMPNPKKALLFQDVMSGKLDGGNHELLWKLFRQAAPENPEICPETFDRVLNMWFIYPSKLTECLFLINPGAFFPIQSELLDPIFPNTKKRPEYQFGDSNYFEDLVEEGGFEKYRELIDDIRDRNSSSEMYEIYFAVR